MAEKYLTTRRTLLMVKELMETARMRLTARMPVGGCIIAPDKLIDNHTELDQILL